MGQAASMMNRQASCCRIVMRAQASILLQGEGTVCVRECACVRVCVVVRTPIAEHNPEVGDKGVSKEQWDGVSHREDMFLRI
jgi:hypothetical protein